MKSSNKNIFYLSIIILLAIIVFAVAAVCNACGPQSLEEEDKIDVGDNNGSPSPSGDPSPNEGDDQNGDGDSEKSAPTVDLEVYMGPEYSAADDVCFYRVEAEVTGNPSPEIEWSRNDGNLGDDFKAQVNLTRDEPDYTLEATVTNSEGSVTESIDLSWGCDGENNDPEISLMEISESDLYTGQTYTITATADDPDGDDITYKWSADDGDISDDNSNPTEWTAPMAAGDYAISLEVQDDKGGTATKDLNVTVEPFLPPPAAAQELPIVQAEGGYIEQNGFTNDGGCLFAGDSGPPDADYAGNKGVRGFISFDISTLSGVTVNSAELTLNIKQVFGDPSSFGHLYIGRVEWGAEPLVVTDFDLPGFPICDFAGPGTGDLFCDTQQLKNQLQNAIDSGEQRFQLRIHFAALSDGDNQWDGLEYNQSDVSLFVVYEG